MEEDSYLYMESSPCVVLGYGRGYRSSQVPERVRRMFT
jgi:hypothetical protein